MLTKRGAMRGGGRERDDGARVRDGRRGHDDGRSQAGTRVTVGGPEAFQARGAAGPEWGRRGTTGQPQPPDGMGGTPRGRHDLADPGCRQAQFWLQSATSPRKYGFRDTMLLHFSCLASHRCRANSWHDAGRDEGTKQTSALSTVTATAVPQHLLTSPPGPVAPCLCPPPKGWVAMSGMGTPP